MTEPQHILHPALRRFVDQARIECQVFEYRCPRRWGGLRLTDDPQVRDCDECKKPVHLVSSESELLEKARQRLCIAVIVPEEIPSPEQLGVSPDFPQPPTEPMMLAGIPMMAHDIQVPSELFPEPPEPDEPPKSMIDRAYQRLKKAFKGD